MSFLSVQESILYKKTRSSQRRSQNSQIPPPCQDIIDNPRPSKKAKKRSYSQQFYIYKDIDVEIEAPNTPESSIPKVLLKPRITIEIPRR